MQQNIYFRKDIWESFKAEERKSELVNNLLRDWYSGKIDNPQKSNREPSVEMPARAAVKSIIKTKDDAVEAVKQLFPDADFQPLYRDKKNKKL